MFETFDFPDTHEPCPRRNATVTPTQPLALMNDEMVMEWSRALAGRVLNDSGLSAGTADRAGVPTWLFRARRTPRRSQTVLDFLDRQSVLVAERLARNEKVPMPETIPQGMDSGPGGGIRRLLSHALLNSNEFIYMN